MKKYYLVLPLLICFLAGCSTSVSPNSNKPSDSGDPTPSPTPTPTPTPTPVDPSDVDPYENEEYEEFFLPTSKIEMSLTFSKEALAKLIKYGQSGDYYKEEMYHPCSFSTTVNGKVTTYEEVGARMRGNWSREDDFDVDEDGNIYGDKLPHLKLAFDRIFNDSNVCDYYVRQYSDEQINERDSRRLFDMKKIDLKWNRNKDESYTRELYALKAFKDVGVVAQSANLLNLSISNGQTTKSKPYMVLESVDKQLIKKNFNHKTLNKGDLYKCTYNSNGPATLGEDTANKVGIESANYSPVYALKTNEETSDMSIMRNFIKDTSVRNVSAEEYKEVFNNKVDVTSFLKFAAMSWVVGNPDDLRNNYNNYYIYFNAENKAVFIPYDNDRVFGITNGLDSNISTMDMFSDRCSNTASGDGCKVPILRRTCVPGSSTRPIIEEYKDIYENYCKKYAEEYLSTSAFKEFTDKFYYSSKNIDTDTHGNMSFSEYASNKLSTIK